MAGQYDHCMYCGGEIKLDGQDSFLCLVCKKSDRISKFDLEGPTVGQFATFLHQQGELLRKADLLLGFFGVTPPAAPSKPPESGSSSTL